MSEEIANMADCSSKGKIDTERRVTSGGRQIAATLVQTVFDLRMRMAAAAALMQHYQSVIVRTPSFSYILTRSTQLILTVGVNDVNVFTTKSSCRVVCQRFFVDEFADATQTRRLSLSAI